MEQISPRFSYHALTSRGHARFALLWRKGKLNACWSAKGGSSQHPPQITCQPRISNWLKTRKILLLLARNTALFITFLLSSYRAGVGEINYVGRRTLWPGWVLFFYLLFAISLKQSRIICSWLTPVGEQKRVGLSHLSPRDKAPPKYPNLPSPVFAMYRPSLEWLTSERLFLKDKKPQTSFMFLFAPDLASIKKHQKAQLVLMARVVRG